MLSRNSVPPQRIENDRDEQVDAVILQRCRSLIVVSEVGCQHGGWKRNERHA